MVSRFKGRFLIILVIAGLAAPLAPFGSTRADNPYVWDEPVKVKRVAREKRKQNPSIANKTEKVRLLTIKWQALKRGDGNTMERIDPLRPLQVGDQLKLAVTPNQDGFLYIVHHSRGLDGNIVDEPHIIFPDPRINNGRNKVAKDQKYIVPASCPEYDDPTDCWWEITPPDGKEFFTFIFSRDEITTLPSQATEFAAAVDQQIIDEIKATSRPEDLKRIDRIKINAEKTEESDGVYVQNTNPKDNEEIVDTIELFHSSGSRDIPGARARALFIKKRADGMRVVVLKDDLPADPARDFRAGEEIQVRFRTNFDAYVYVVNVTPGGKKRLLFPCSRNRDGKVFVGAENILPGPAHGFAFDAEAGTEVLLVVMSRTRIGELDEALASCCRTAENCCDRFVCDLGASASRAVDQLILESPTQTEGGIATANAPALEGARTRGVKLAPGRDKGKAETYIAIEDKEGTKLGSGKPAVIFVRLRHI